MNIFEMSLTPSEFSNILRMLNMLKDYNNDMMIHDGIIRQRSNDNSTIFELDCTEILNNINTPITNIKQKVNLLKVKIQSFFFPIKS